MRDNISNVQTVDLGKDTLSGVTPNASAWLDTLGFGKAALELLTDAVTDAGTAAGFTATMQHSDTTAAADAVDVLASEVTDGSTISVTVTADGDDNIAKGAVGYNGSKRYIRFNTIGTTGTDAVIRTLGRMGSPAQAPTTYVGASVAAT
jgi:hypothetical protein